MGGGCEEFDNLRAITYTSDTVCSTGKVGLHFSVIPNPSHPTRVVWMPRASLAAALCEHKILSKSTTSSSPVCIIIYNSQPRDQTRSEDCRHKSLAVFNPNDEPQRISGAGVCRTDPNDTRATKNWKKCWSPHLLSMETQHKSTRLVRSEKGTWHGVSEQPAKSKNDQVMGPGIV